MDHNNSKKDMTDNDCFMYRPFQMETSRHIHIKRDHYSTSLDPRGYIPVYEYVINNTPIMWDRETGYVHFTGIWKALGNSKSDIVKMVDSNPELGTKKIRGGFLRIQGTWIPYDFAHMLCKRTAWPIRHQLVPIFGQRFPAEALSPDHPDYGCLLLNPCSKKSMKRMRQQQKPYNRVSKEKVKKVGKVKQQEKMMVTRLLNEEESSTDDDILSSEEELSDSEDHVQVASHQSPSFRVIQTYPSKEGEYNWSPLLPPIHTGNSYFNQEPISRTPSPSTPSLSPTMSNVTHIAQDIIDTISATILLQRLSQDDGRRPFKPLECSVIPQKVIVGQQEFTICWD